MCFMQKSENICKRGINNMTLFLTLYINQQNPLLQKIFRSYSLNFCHCPQVSKSSCKICCRFTVVI